MRIRSVFRLRIPSILPFPALFSGLFLLASCQGGGGNEAGSPTVPAGSEAPRGRYEESVFSAVLTAPGIAYDTAVAVTGGNTVLRLDFYEPAGDSLAKRPFILFAHGGYFLGGERSHMEAFCHALARKGYATATLTYRLGAANPNDPVSMREAVWRAVQDGRSALAFMAAHADSFGLDTARFFVGGYSAGAILSLHAAYLDRPEEIFPGVDTARWGGLSRHGPPPVKAVLNMAGALQHPSYMKRGGPALISLHGREDRTVPFGFGPLYAPGTNQVLTEGYGSGVLHRRADSLGLYHRLRALSRQGHEAPMVEVEEQVRFLAESLLPLVRRP